MVEYQRSFFFFFKIKFACRKIPAVDWMKLDSTVGGLYKVYCLDFVCEYFYFQVKCIDFVCEDSYFQINCIDFLCEDSYFQIKYYLSMETVILDFSV